MNCRSCQHAKSGHQHYRRGTDCAFCECAKYRRQWLRSWRFSTMAPTADSAVSTEPGELRRAG